MSDQKETASWSDFGDAMGRLTKSVETSGFEPDCIVAIARGGLLVGGALGYSLGIKDVFTINIEHYAGTGLDDVELPEPIVLEPGFDSSLVTGRKVLIADDVADSGITLEFMAGLLGPAAEIRSAVWYTKPRSKVTADFSASTTDRWIVFPWSPFSPFGDRKDA